MWVNSQLVALLYSSRMVALSYTVTGEIYLWDPHLLFFSLFMAVSHIGLYANSTFCTFCCSYAVHPYKPKQILQFILAVFTLHYSHSFQSSLPGIICGCCKIWFHMPESRNVPDCLNQPFIHLDWMCIALQWFDSLIVAFCYALWCSIRTRFFYMLRCDALQCSMM